MVYGSGKTRFETIETMRRLVPLFVFGVLVCAFMTFRIGAAQTYATGSHAPAHGLALSDMKVQITSNGHAATFQLYDTTAAEEFYNQLPLTLDLTNFRDAQWMFYPPKKLNVTKGEAYHDGKKGELSYYAPWGDVFMLYKNFYAGDDMHRLGVGLRGIDHISEMSGSAVIKKIHVKKPEEKTTMNIQVITNDQTIVFQLNDSPAAHELYAQLPMRIEVENYGNKEKIFYPPRKLSTGNTPLARNVRPGTLAYYAPWGDVVMFYGSFGSAAGLYELGRAVQGGELIKNLSGTIEIEK